MPKNPPHKPEMAGLGLDRRGGGGAEKNFKGPIMEFYHPPTPWTPKTPFALLTSRLTEWEASV